MTPEQKEVLRRYLDGSCYWSSDIDDNRQFFDKKWRDDDRQLLEEFLSEHPADDDVLTNREWIEKRWVGTPASLDVPKWYWISIRVFLREDEDGFWTANTPDSNPDAWHPICVLRTLGDVRLLCRALGVPLAE